MMSSDIIWNWIMIYVIVMIVITRHLGAWFSKRERSEFYLRFLANFSRIKNWFLTGAKNLGIFCRWWLHCKNNFSNCILLFFCHVVYVTDMYYHYFYKTALKERGHSKRSWQKRRDAYTRDNLHAFLSTFYAL